MTMVVLTDAEILRDRCAELQQRLSEAKLEIAALKAEKPQTAASWLQSKVEAQNKALRILNRRVRLQRLILREHALADPEAFDAMYRLTRDKYASELGPESNLDTSL